MANPCDFYINGKKMKMDEFLSYAKKLPHSQLNDILGGIPSFKNIPTAPFVTDTNAWTKLALKVALKEAVKQGVDKIAWTTGEQQNERYDLSKQVDKIEIVKRDGVDSYRAKTYKDGKILNDQDYISFKELEGMFGKEIAKGVSEGKTSFEGEGLKVGGKGMKGFYGSPTEGSLGIVGNVAKSLFKQEPKTINIIVGYDKRLKTSNVKSEIFKNEDGDWELKYTSKEGERLYSTYFDTKEDAVKQNQRDIPTQQSIDITPELKQQVSEGLPLFMASAPKEDFAEALNEYDNLIKNPKGTTEYIKKFGLEKIKKIKDITSNFGTYIAALEKSNYITKKIC
jgi:hypothetical protein